MSRAHNSGWAAGALAILAAFVLSGCIAGDPGTISPDSITCQSAQALFTGSDADRDDAQLDILQARAPEGLRATVESLRDYPASDQEWKSYEVALAKVQDWAVSACGVSVAFPAEAGDTKPRLEDFLSAASRDGEMISVLVSGATGLDAAVFLCEQALDEYAEAGHPMTLAVKDALGIVLSTLDDAGKCVISPEFAP